MKVISVNKGESRLVDWRGKQVKTGIFKYPVESPIFLGEEDVVGDAVVDRKHHGGVDKAVYAYSADHYPFWKNQFLNADWAFGMFGENLTIEGLDESKMKIGTRYKIGEALIEVCQPRQPCFKLGIRFGTQSILKRFMNKPFSGVYFKVIKTGKVQIGDGVELVLNRPNSPSIAQVYNLMYRKGSEAKSVMNAALQCEYLPINCKNKIKQTQGY